MRFKLSSVNRPLGVSILAVLHVLQALVLFVGGLALLSVRLLRPRIFLRMPHLTGLLSVLGGVLFVIALLALLLAYGLWFGKGWAWTFSFILAILGIIFSVVILFLRAGLGSAITLILDLVIIYYLLQPNVKAFFNKGSPSPVQVVPQTVQEPKATGMIAKYCSNCGGPAKQEELYCSHCGAKLT
jgi:uncharacterized membrane protein (DUF2068 family)